MLRPWAANLVVRQGRSGNLCLRIAQAVIEEIQRGRLSAGDPLPGTREMARTLGVNRKTVAQAYDELVAQGWVRTDERRGTFVSKSIGDVVEGLVATGRTIPAIETRRSRELAAPLPWRRRGEGGFDDGVPDQRLIPTTSIARAYADAARTAARTGLLAYGDPRGTAQMRQSISRMLNVTRGLSASAENICVTRGSQMALYVIAHCIVANGDSVVFEELTYPPAIQAFRLAGARTPVARLTPEGIDLDHLEALCRSERVRAVYLTPGHQFPTTVVLRPDRRLRLRALAAQFGFLVIEDDYDHEFHFDHQPVLPMASNDPTGQIIYVGSFSKVLSPSLRVGYVAADPALIEQLGRWIAAIDRQGDPVTELAIVELIESGHLRRHIKRVHGIFKARRAAFASSLAELLPDLATFDVPSGGLAFWVKLVADLDRPLAEHVRRGEGRALLTSIECSPTMVARPAVRLGFASLDEVEARLRLEAFARVLRPVSR